MVSSTNTPKKPKPSSRGFVFVHVLLFKAKQALQTK